MRRLMLVAIPLLAIGCAKSPEPAAPAAATQKAHPETAAVSAPPAEKAATPSAEVVLASTEGNTATGNLTLSNSEKGVLISGDLSGLVAGSEHGFHIHENGDCSAPDASSAGGHFNPHGAQHGKPGSEMHHAGDMFNIVADAEGHAHIKTVVANVNLDGAPENNVRGKAIVLHQKADDYVSQPAGDSGPRIACGVIR